MHAIWESHVIKWFDADRFLPGKEVRTILIRYEIFGSNGYEIGRYEDSQWISLRQELIEDDYTIVTHWAFIEEPM